jgi:hypothetical protein
LRLRYVILADHGGEILFENRYQSTTSG